ncbi:MAG TPA: S9 family peptidase [Thermoanaerobaculia bacterium]|nr:S9 family peptidase [Thermoanaerobaculia bacterium]
MRKLTLAGFVLLAFSTLSLSAAQPAKKFAVRPSKQYTIEQFFATTRVRDASFSSDESRILFSSDQTGVYNVYSVPVTGGAPMHLTSSATDTTYAISYFPNDGRVLYTRDQGGNELNHLYVREADGKERDLTPGEKLKADFDGWTGDHTALWVETNERDPKYFDLYRYDAKTYERTLVYRNEGYNVGAISPDGKWVALVKTNGTSDSDIYLWSAATSEAKNITPHEGQADNTPQQFDPKTGTLYFSSNDGSEFTRLRRYDVSTGKTEDVEKPAWDVLFTRFSKNGRYRATGINDDGRTVVHLLDTQTGREVALPKLPAGDITTVRFADSEKRMAFYVSGDRSPANLYVYEFGAKAPVRLTDSRNRQIDPADLVESEVARFKSFDGMVIPSIYYKPLQATATNRVPALVWVHGGPGDQTRKGWSATIQYLVNHGYAVLGINNRGSSGYGKSFYVADDQKHGKEPLDDCVEGRKYLAALPYVDANRIGILGGSYGGYMVLAALAFRPEEFAVGVDIFGVSNWLRTLQGIPKWWEAQRLALYKEIGDPEKDEAMLREISPVFHADRIRRPLLVLQGANDPRVVKPESDDIVAEVKKNGVPVEYIVFPDEGHGFTKKKNQIEGYGAILTFLDKYLKGAPAARAAAGG